MSDSNDDKTTSVTGKKTFSLKRPSVEQGMVRQEMGRGRTKAVVVETRKRRINRPEDDKPVPPVTLKPRPAAAAEKPAEPAPAAKPAAGAASTPAAPSRAPAAREDFARSDHSGSDHHSGARQPHGRACRGCDQVPDEAGPDA
jgi:translation initiation factor IF-2